MRISDWSSDVCSSDLDQISDLFWDARRSPDQRLHLGIDVESHRAGRDAGGLLALDSHDADDHGVDDHRRGENEIGEVGIAWAGKRVSSRLFGILSESGTDENERRGGRREEGLGNVKHACSVTRYQRWERRRVWKEMVGTGR